MRIGTFEPVHNLSDEYGLIAQHDERVAEALIASGEFRHAAYLLIQAIEKYLRSKIFSIVDGRNTYFRDQNRNHSVEEAADFLVQVVSSNAEVQKQIRSQLDRFVFQGVRFNHLHNNLRYPFFSDRSQGFVLLKVNAEDIESIQSRLRWVKQFLKSV